MSLTKQVTKGIAENISKLHRHMWTFDDVLLKTAADK